MAPLANSRARVTEGRAAKCDAEPVAARARAPEVRPRRRVTRRARARCGMAERPVDARLAVAGGARGARCGVPGGPDVAAPARRGRVRVLRGRERRLGVVTARARAHKVPRRRAMAAAARVGRGVHVHRLRERRLGVVTARARGAEMLRRRPVASHAIGVRRVRERPLRARPMTRDARAALLMAGHVARRARDLVQVVAACAGDRDVCRGRALGGTRLAQPHARGRVENAGPSQRFTRHRVSRARVTANAGALLRVVRVRETGPRHVGQVCVAADARRLSDRRIAAREGRLGREVVVDLFERDDLVRDTRNRAGIDVALHTRDVLVRPRRPRTVVRLHLMARRAELRLLRCVECDRGPGTEHDHYQGDCGEDDE